MRTYSDKYTLGRVRQTFPNVTRVVDAEKPIKIVVSPRDANGATPKAPEDCAMARACKRTLGADGAIIRPSTAYIIRGTTATRYRVPESVTREIVTFDRHSDFRAGEYHLGVVDSAHRLGAQQGSPDRRKGGGHKRRPAVIHHRTVGIR